MSIELSILKLFCDDREAEARSYGYIETLNNLEPEVKLLFTLVHSYYKEDWKGPISKEELISYYQLKHPNAKAKDIHLDLIGQVFLSNISIDLLQSHLDHLIEKHVSTQIINKLIPAMEGDKYGILSSVEKDVRDYVELLHSPPDSLVVPVPCTLSVEELVAQETKDGGLDWHLSELTDIIGGCRRKTLGLIYAFVDSGKTSFALASCANFARQLLGTDEKICYCGNEEAADRVKLRLTQAFTGWTRSQVLKNGAGASKIAVEEGLNSVMIFDSITSSAQIEYVLNEYKPHVLFIDQATGVELSSKKRLEGVAALEQLFKWYRKLCITHNVGIIGIAQGDKKAEDMKWLKLSDIYGAKVVIQGALDYAIGIGRKVNNPIDEALRYVHIPKNKLAGGNDGKFAVHFDKYNCSWEVN